MNRIALCLAVILLTACGDDAPEPAPTGNCAATHAGLSTTVIPESLVGTAILPQGVQGGLLVRTVTEGKTSSLFDMVGGAPRPFVGSPFGVLVAHDAHLLLRDAKASVTPKPVDGGVFWAATDGTPDGAAISVPNAITWRAITATAAFGDSQTAETGARSKSVHRLDRATGVVSVVDTLTLADDHDYLSLDGLGGYGSQPGQTARHLVGLRVRGEAISLYLLPLDGSAPREAAFPGGALDAIVVASSASRVFFRWRPTNADSYLPHILSVDPDAPEQAIDLGIFEAQPGMSDWEPSTGYAIANDSKLVLAYSSLQLNADFTAGDRTVFVVSSDLGPNSLKPAGCFTNAFAAPTFAGHASIGIFTRSPALTGGTTFYQLTDPL